MVISMLHKHGGDIYQNPNVIDFSANINFLGMPKAVKAAAMQGIEEAVHYPEAGNRTLVEKIAGFHALSASHVIAGNGAAEIIFALVHARKPQKALLTAPSFYEYEQALLGEGCEIIKYYLKKENAFKIQKVDEFLNRIYEGVDMVFLCNPNNPTGTLTERKVLERVLAACKQMGAVLVVDESFLEFCPMYEEYTMCGNLADLQMGNSLFILKSFTKMYAMPGLRLGFGLSADTELIRKMQENLQPWNVSLPAQYAGIVALQEDEFIQKTRECVAAERQYLTKGLGELGLDVYEGAANFVLFFGQETLGERCLNKGILLRDCSNFDGLMKGWYRVAVKRHEENRELLNVLKSCLEER